MSDGGETYGCETCWLSDASTAWVARQSLSLARTLIDESHFIVSIRTCTHCAQGFVSVFTETVDWEDGDDPQRWVVMPLTGNEATALEQHGTAVDEATLDGIGQGRRSLCHDHPKGTEGRSFWTRGMFVGFS